MATNIWQTSYIPTLILSDPNHYLKTKICFEDLPCLVVLLLKPQSGTLKFMRIRMLTIGYLSLHRICRKALLKIALLSFSELLISGPHALFQTSRFYYYVAKLLLLSNQLHYCMNSMLNTYNKFPKYMDHITKQTSEVEICDAAHRLWKKLSSKQNKSDEKSAQKSIVNTKKSNTNNTIECYQQIRSEKDDLNDFLHQVHNKMKEADQASESQIMERVSLDWPEEQLNKSKSILSEKKREDNYLQNQGWATERAFPAGQMINLRDVKSLLQLKQLISKINPMISQEIAQTLGQNSRLTQQCNTLRYNQKKTLLKVQLLNNEIKMLEKQNEELKKSMRSSGKKNISEPSKQIVFDKQTKQCKEFDIHPEQQANDKSTNLIRKETQLSNSCEVVGNVEVKMKQLQEETSKSCTASRTATIENNEYNRIVADIFRTQNRTRKG